MKVYVKETGHWTDSNPGDVDHWIAEGLDIRDYYFRGSTEYEVKTATQGN